jgi:hypothetical protein
MKHVILVFIVLILIPLVSRWWSHSLGRGFAVVLLAAAFGQIFYRRFETWARRHSAFRCARHVSVGDRISLDDFRHLLDFLETETHMKHLTNRCS